MEEGDTAFMSAMGHVFWRFINQTAVRAPIIPVIVPYGKLAVGAAPSRGLIGNEDMKHLCVARHCMVESRPPDWVKVSSRQKPQDVFIWKEMPYFGSSPMFLQVAFSGSVTLLFDV